MLFLSRVTLHYFVNSKLKANNNTCCTFRCFYASGGWPHPLPRGLWERWWVGPEGLRWGPGYMSHSFRAGPCSAAGLFQGQSSGAS